LPGREVFSQGDDVEKINGRIHLETPYFFALVERAVLGAVRFVGSFERSTEAVAAWRFIASSKIR